MVYQGGTAPVLTSDYSSPLVFNLANADVPAITFKWTNPDYKFNTGLSSQDVTYFLQVDTTGSNFTNPRMQEFSYSAVLGGTLTTNQLNDALVAASKMRLAANVPHNIEFRVKATINSQVPLYSNVVKVVVTPYPDPNIPTLFITGDATQDGWTNAPQNNPKFVYDAANDRFTLNSIAFTPGLGYKFLTKFGQWQPQWGGAPATGGALSVNPGNGSDPNPIPTPAVAGNYKLVVDLNARTFTITKL